MDIVATIFGLLQAVAGFILVLFIPGYALGWALYPRREDLTFMGRMAISLILSLSAVILMALFIDLVLGIDTTTSHIVLSLIVLTGLAVFVWKLEILYLGWVVEQQSVERATKYQNIFTGRIARLSPTLFEQKQKVQRLFILLMKDYKER